VRTKTLVGGLAVASAAALAGAPPGHAAHARAIDSRSSAIALVKRKGYVPNASTWVSSFKLDVLIGRAAKSADGYNQRAFFFNGGRYLGTDATAPSARMQEVWRDDRTIAILYILYRSNDPLCCPTAGGAIVRFRWSGSRLVALDPIPATSGARHR
jgi:LppP/LprE lipoprotein